jgi:hypothetical protein
VVTVITCMLASGHLVLAHDTASLPELDDWQYRTGWPAGYAFKRAAEYIARNGSRLVDAPGTRVVRPKGK